MSKTSLRDILRISELARKTSLIVPSNQVGARRELQEVEKKLKSILEPLDLLAETLVEDDGIISSVEVQEVLTECRQTIQALSLLFVRYQDLYQLNGQTGQATERILDSPLSGTSEAEAWTKECDNIKALQSLLLTRVKTISSLSSPASPRPKGQRAFSDSEVEFVGQVNLKSGFAPESRQGIEYSPSLRGSSPVLNKGIDSSLYDVLEEVLPGQTSSTHANPEGFPVSSADGITRSASKKITDHRQKLIVSDLSKSYGSNSMDEPYTWGKDPVLTTDANGEILSGSDIGLATSLSRHQSYSPQLMHSSPSVSEGHHSQASYHGPLFSSSQASPVYRRQCMTFPEDVRPTSALPTLSVNTASLHEMFEKEITKNAVVLCEERATGVNYAGWNQSTQDWSMVQAASECRVLLVRKINLTSKSALRYATSIWVLSTDKSVRLEQKLDMEIATIPYTAWGDTEKVSLRIASMLIFHDLSIMNAPAESVQTSWINFVFESEAGSINFQSALMEKRLVLSVRTAKTMRVQEGVAGIVSIQEQLCGLENLRLWEDQGAVQAMIHFKAQIQAGYMVFPLNSTRLPLEFREDGSRNVKLKGLDIPWDNKRASYRSSSDGAKSLKAEPEKRMNSIRIEFIMEGERNRFLHVCREVQRCSID